MEGEALYKVDTIDSLLEAYNKLVSVDQEFDNKLWNKTELIAALNNAIEYYNDKEDE